MRRGPVTATRKPGSCRSPSPVRSHQPETLERLKGQSCPSDPSQSSYWLELLLPRWDWGWRRPVRSPPPPAPTWQTTFRDNFDGSGLPNATDWQFTLGTSYPGGPDAFGTGEIETLTKDPKNVDVRGGNLYITPQRDQAGAWTSARIETNRANFKPADGGVMHVESRVQMPNVTGARGARLLARLLDAGWPLPRRPVVVAEHRRIRHHGKRPRPELVLRRPALRHLGWTLQRTGGPEQRRDSRAR